MTIMIQTQRQMPSALPVSEVTCGTGHAKVDNHGDDHSEDIPHGHDDDADDDSADDAGLLLLLLLRSIPPLPPRFDSIRLPRPVPRSWRLLRHPGPAGGTVFRRNNE